jgi:hypothetical protein
VRGRHLPISSTFKDKSFLCLYVSGQARFSAWKWQRRGRLGSIARAGSGIEMRQVIVPNVTSWVEGNRPVCRFCLSLLFLLLFPMSWGYSTASKYSSSYPKQAGF